MFGLFIFMVVIYLMAGISASIFYHRVLTHKVIKLQPWFEKLLVIMALPAGTPVQWVGTHRQHHLFTDELGDPHSPLLYGFWYAHCGWYIHSKNPIICFCYALGGPLRFLFDSFWRPKNKLEYNHLAEDLNNVPFYSWISKPLNYMLAMWIYLTTLIIIAIILGGSTGIIFLWLILIFVYNLGDSVNSIGHLYGGNENAKNKAVNNPILAFFTFGEGYHLNHHLAPNQLLPNSKSNYSLTRSIITTWKALGLVKEDKLATKNSPKV